MAESLEKSAKFKKDQENFNDGFGDDDFDLEDDSELLDRKKLEEERK